MKTLLYTIALVISVGTMAFASNGTPKKKNPTASPEIVLSAEEVILEAELSKELDIDIDQVIASLSTPTAITSVKVYDFTGAEIASQQGTIDYTKIPAGAELLMTDGTTQYYIVK